jgi:hypothetical protein
VYEVINIANQAIFVEERFAYGAEELSSAISINLEGPTFETRIILAKVCC